MLLSCGCVCQILDVVSEAETEVEKVCKAATGVTLSALHGKVVHINSDVLKKMKPEELMRLWQVGQGQVTEQAFGMFG